MNALCSGSLAMGHGSSSALNGMASNCEEALEHADSKETSQDPAVNKSPPKRGRGDESAGTMDAASSGQE